MLKLYNTLSRKKENFKPLKGKKVGVYSCGPTVYWNQHIGNMYAFLQWDLLVRFLRYENYKVEWVMNITDVGHLTSDQDAGEDKMEKGAKREGLTVWEIAKKYEKQFLQSMDLMNIQRPDVLCRATDHIQEQIDLIKKIEENGFAYKTKTGLVFDTAKFPGYAKFAKLDLEKQFAGSRVEVDQDKKQPWDFLLWVTNQPSHVMQWDSPWGKGFPGWHIECTAMSTKYLGNQFDIHTGGKEHVPVHHTNEIAQAFGAFGKQTAKYWLHNEWLLLDGEKVSKSSGNIVLATAFLEKGIDPLAFRYLALTSHYRKGLNFSWEALRAAAKGLEDLKNRLSGLNLLKPKAQSPKSKSNAKFKKYKNDFRAFFEDDLNAPKALALAWKLVKDKKVSGKEKYDLLMDFDKVFGLNLGKVEKTEIPEEIKKLANEREKQRKEKNWAKSDELRKEIEEKGFKIEDTSEGPEIKKL